MKACFVKNPITGVDGDALLADGLLFDIGDIWSACMYGVSAVEFYNFTPVEMAEIALELLSAGMIDQVKSPER